MYTLQSFFIFFLFILFKNFLYFCFISLLSVLFLSFIYNVAHAYLTVQLPLEFVLVLFFIFIFMSIYQRLAALHTQLNGTPLFGTEIYNCKYVFGWLTSHIK